MAISYSLVAPKNDTIVIDRTRAADPVTYNFKLKIKNQGTSTVYYKLTESSGVWSISSPSNGELGSVGSGSSKIFDITLQRALPTSDVVETIDLTLEAYSDSGYTNLVDSVSFSMTAILADIHSWPSYTKYDFDDGTAQGWTLSGASIQSDKSIEASGYAVKISTDDTSPVSHTATLTKSETLPSNDRVVFLFYFTAYIPHTSAKINYIQIKVNGDVVFDTGATLLSTSITTWDMIGVDLSSYAGQSVTIDIVVSCYVDKDNVIHIDDIIIAGTDTL